MIDAGEIRRRIKERCGNGNRYVMAPDLLAIFADPDVPLTKKTMAESDIWQCPKCRRWQSKTFDRCMSEYDTGVPCDGVQPSVRPPAPPKPTPGSVAAEKQIEHLDDWQNAIAGGHHYLSAEDSPSGKMGWRCVFCNHYSNAPVKAKFDQCKENKIAAAINAKIAARDEAWRQAILSSRLGSIEINDIVREVRAAAPAAATPGGGEGKVSHE